MHYTQQICEKLDLDTEFILDTKREILLQEVIDSLLFTNSIEEASAALDVSIDIFKKYLSIISPFVSKGISERWYNPLFRILDLKRCATCKKVLPYSFYHKDNSRVDGIRKHCIECGKKYVQDTIEDRRTYYSNYYKLNKADFVARCATRRARKLRATPTWANLSLIKDFYRNCPEDMEVDHIIPLQNELVCGLHTLENLQYLNKSINRQKSNKFEVI